MIATYRKPSKPGQPTQQPHQPRPEPHRYKYGGADMDSYYGEPELSQEYGEPGPSRSISHRAGYPQSHWTALSRTGSLDSGDMGKLKAPLSQWSEQPQPHRSDYPPSRTNSHDSGDLWTSKAQEPFQWTEQRRKLPYYPESGSSQDRPSNRANYSSPSPRTEYHRPMGPRTSHSRTGIETASRYDDYVPPSTAQTGESSNQTASRPDSWRSPFELAELVRTYGKALRLMEAIDVVKDSPLSSQNVVVWTTLIDLAMKARRSKVAFELYTDMKRRGFKPIPTTWTIMFRGFAALAARGEPYISNKSKLARVYSVYANLVTYIQEARLHKPEDLVDCIIPLNAYLFFLMQSGLHEQLLGTYNTMDETGPLSPDAFTYTYIFQALLKRTEGKMEGEGEGTMDARNAALGMRIWKRMTDRLERGEASFEIDAHLLSAMLRLLTASPRAPDLFFGLSLIDKHLKLHQPGAKPPPLKPFVPRTFDSKAGPPAQPPPPPALTTHSLQTALLLTTKLRRYRLLLHYMQQIMDSPSKSLLHTGHLHLALSAYAALANAGADDIGQALETLEWMLRQDELGHSHLKPTRETFNIVLMCCWRSADYRAARRVFALMSGHFPEDFDGPATPRAPEPRYKNCTYVPDANDLSLILHTAMATKNPHDVAHALRILQHIGLDELFGPEYDYIQRRPGSRASTPEPSRHMLRVAAFGRAKLADAVLELIDSKAQMPYAPDFRHELEGRAQAARQDFLVKWPPRVDGRGWSEEGVVEQVAEEEPEQSPVWL